MGLGDDLLIDKGNEEEAMQNIKADNEIRKKIHYPGCWDTAAYPTLASALWELIHIDKGKLCPTCNKQMGL